MKAKQEVWRPVVGYEGSYEVSNLGKVKSLDRLIYHKESDTYHRVKGRLLSICLDRKGYQFVALGAKRSSQKRVHRLVAEAFIPNPENKTFVDHINTIRTDNRIDNLRWVTCSENCNNPNSLSKRTIRVAQIDPMTDKVIKIWPSVSSVERAFNSKNISACCNGKIKTARNYKWKHCYVQSEDN